MLQSVRLADLACQLWRSWVFSAKIGALKAMHGADCEQGKMKLETSGLVVFLAPSLQATRFGLR